MFGTRLAKVVGGVAAAPGQRRLERPAQVVERPRDDDDVVGVAQPDHHHRGEADALEDRNAVPDGHAARLEVLAERHLHQEQRNAQRDDTDEIWNEEGACEQCQTFFSFPEYSRHK